jgi:hypothetical protein
MLDELEDDPMSDVLRVRYTSTVFFSEQGNMF